MDSIHAGTDGVSSIERLQRPLARFRHSFGGDRAKLAGFFSLRPAPITVQLLHNVGIVLNAEAALHELCRKIRKKLKVFIQGATENLLVSCAKFGTLRVPTGSSGVLETPLSVKSAGASPPQSSGKHLHINLGNQFRAGGSLPNVNNNANCGNDAKEHASSHNAAIHSIDLKCSGGGSASDQESRGNGPPLNSTARKAAAASDSVARQLFDGIIEARVESVGTSKRRWTIASN
ncbi:hypothetical protein WN51_03398 [Melipona quadrifasciata]|uniref:Uncharacterized protein n=1 Tax=Melipona quadrifasciata TaxID=166423 RepID=A0A0M8ZWG5_9HYME|nr:hypothetical protein WN51_03398 [Melipona quadrifasciata]